MTTFTKGPAAGQCLLLRRSPLFLRVVRSQAGKWDALDQLDDKPEPGETIVAYRLVKTDGPIHLNMGGKGSGFYQRATYEVVEPQPDAATLTDTTAWRAWAQRTAKA